MSELKTKSEELNNQASADQQENQELDSPAPQTINNEETVMADKKETKSESPKARIITHKDVAAYIMDEKNSKEIEQIQNQSGEVVTVIANQLIKAEVERSVEEAIKQEKIDPKDKQKTLISRYLHLQDRFHNELSSKEVVNALVKAVTIAFAAIGIVYTGMAVYGWYQQRKQGQGTDAFASNVSSVGRGLKVS